MRQDRNSDSFRRLAAHAAACTMFPGSTSRIPTRPSLGAVIEVLVQLGLRGFDRGDVRHAGPPRWQP